MTGSGRVDGYLMYDGGSGGSVGMFAALVIVSVVRSGSLFLEIVRGQVTTASFTFLVLITIIVEAYLCISNRAVGKAW
jgi:hypothetical protein